MIETNGVEFEGLSSHMIGLFQVVLYMLTLQSSKLNTYFFVTYRMVWANLSVFRIVGPQLQFYLNPSKTGPFKTRSSKCPVFKLRNSIQECLEYQTLNNWTHFYHLNTIPIRYLNHDCIEFMLHHLTMKARNHLELWLCQDFKG